MPLCTRNERQSDHGVRSQQANSEFSLSAEQIRRLIEAAPTHRDRALLRLLAETGIRRQELAMLEASDIDVATRLIFVRHGKGGKRRMIPLTDTLALELSMMIRKPNQSPVFASRQSEFLSLRQINRIVAQAGIRAGITHPNPKCAHITCHLLRHSFARLWKSHNGSIESLSKILGHSSVKTTWDVYGTESLIDVQANYASTLSKMFSGNSGKDNSK